MLLLRICMSEIIDDRCRVHVCSVARLPSRSSSCSASAPCAMARPGSWVVLLSTEHGAVRWARAVGAGCRVAAACRVPGQADA